MPFYNNPFGQFSDHPGSGQGLVFDLSLMNLPGKLSISKKE